MRIYYIIGILLTVSIAVLITSCKADQQGSNSVSSSTLEDVEVSFEGEMVAVKDIPRYLSAEVNNIEDVEQILRGQVQFPEGSIIEDYQVRFNVKEGSAIFEEFKTIKPYVYIFRIIVPIESKEELFSCLNKNLKRTHSDYILEEQNGAVTPRLYQDYLKDLGYAVDDNNICRYEYYYNVLGDEGEYMFRAYLDIAITDQQIVVRVRG